MSQETLRAAAAIGTFVVIAVGTARSAMKAPSKTARATLLVMILLLLIIVIIVSLQRVVSSDERHAIVRAEENGLSSRILSVAVPQGYKWSAGVTLTPRVYLVELRTRKGEGWSWRVDLDSNDVQLISGRKTPAVLASVPNLPIPLSRLPELPVGAGSVAAGAAVFTSSCESCHGAKGVGGDGPHIAGAGLSAGQVAFMVRRPQAIDQSSAMPALQLSDQEVANVAAYVASLR